MALVRPRTTAWDGRRAGYLGHVVFLLAVEPFFRDMEIVWTCHWRRGLLRAAPALESGRRKGICCFLGNPQPKTRCLTEPHIPLSSRPVFLNKDSVTPSPLSQGASDWRALDPRKVTNPSIRCDHMGRCGSSVTLGGPTAHKQQL